MSEATQTICSFGLSETQRVVMTAAARVAGVSRSKLIRDAAVRAAVEHLERLEMEGQGSSHPMKRNDR